MVLASALFALSTAACAPEHKPAAPPRPALVTEVEGDSALSVIVAGQVRGTSNQDIPAEYGGRVLALHANVGDTVVAGQTLAELDSSVAKLQATQARAQLGQATAELESARREKARQEALVAGGASSPQDLDAAATALRRAEAQHLAADAQVALARRAVAKSVVRAPVSGVIAARQIELGSMVAAGQTAFALDAGGERDILAQVPNALSANLRPGGAVTYQYGQTKGQARITGVGQRVAGVDASAMRLRVVSGSPPAGASVHVRLPGPGSDGAAQVPLSAILTDRDGKRRVLVVNADGVTRNTPVTIVAVTAAGALVRGALQPGQRVIAAGGEFLKPGERVRALPFTR